MIKYYVDDVRGDRIYEGFDRKTAYRLCRDYNDCCCGTFRVFDIDTDLDEFEKEDENTFVFYDNEYLTSLYGSDEGIKQDIKMALEYQLGKKIIDFDLDYSDPGDSGENATFWAQNIQWE